MRADLLPLLAWSVLASAPPPDSIRVIAPPESTLATPRPLPPDTIPSGPPVVAAEERATRGIDMAAERKRGSASLEEALPLRMPTLLDPLPISGPLQGSLRLPAGGQPIRLESWRAVEIATDEHAIGSWSQGWGAPWLAFALDDPRGEAIETLDVDRLEADAPGTLVPRGPAFDPPPRDSVRASVARTTLLYRRGGGDAQLTGARLDSRVFRRRIYASYARNQANGWAPLRETLSWRYALRAEIGRWAAHRFEVEGLLHERAIEDSSLGSSEWEHRSAALHVTHQGERVSDRFRIGLQRDKKTWVLTQDLNLTTEGGARERWEFPAVLGEAAITYRFAPSLTWVGSARAASRRIVYRVDTLPLFEPRREEARFTTGIRAALGRSAGLGLEAAYDARESSPGFLDGRATLWGGTERARGRLDLESAHDRPTWIDLLTPMTAHTFFSPVTFQTSSLLRAGDPTLRPRRLTGGLGSVAFTLGSGLALELSGSYRRVTDDFGWDVSADSVGGAWTVTSFARVRGSGWLSHGGLAWDLRRGAFRFRGAGWMRGGSNSLSPRAGSPPRRAIDASAECRVVLFQGDLPLRFEGTAHARGPRRGLIREPGQITWDGQLAADFGPAAAYLRVLDLFDRRPGSAIWDPTRPGGAPMPGRILQAGVVWNLLD